MTSGGPGAWRPDAELEAKFHAFTEGVLSPARARDIWAMRERLLDPGRPLSELAVTIRQGDSS